MSSDNHNVIEYGFSEKTLNIYVVGLMGSLILTLLSFAVVYYRLFSSSVMLAAIFVFAIFQLIIQSVCFLRVNASSEGRWNLLPYMFVIMMITFLAGGSLWIMQHLNEHIGWS